jgi:hypothetical protein
MDPFYRTFHCPNCLHLSLFINGYNSRLNFGPYREEHIDIRWTGVCARCHARVEVSNATSSAVLETLSTQYLENQNDKLSKENQALKVQLAKIKELVK